MRYMGWKHAPRLRRAARRARRVVALAISPVSGVLALLPGAVMAAGVAAVAATAAVAAGPIVPASAATGTPVLVLLQNGETTAPEATALQNAGYSVTQDTPAQWLALTAAQFKAYAAIVIGDPSSGSCSTLTPTTATSGTDAIGTTWQSAVSGNLAVIGTAPALPGTSAATTLITNSVAYAAAGWSSSSNTGTGLYLSLNCEYSTSAANTAVPLLNGVEGISSSNGLTVQGSLSCSDSGTVNGWGAANAGTFSGYTSASLAAAGSTWPSPSCPVKEAFDSWPGKTTTWSSGTFTPLAYDGASDATANFTASAGATGQPYILLASPTQPSASLSPSTGGQVPADAATGGSNTAVPGLAQPLSGDVNTESGDFTQSSTDASVPGFGPSLSFSRSYDATAAQRETQTGIPGPLGYGWTDNWASALSTTSPVPGDLYTIDGLRTTTGDGVSPAHAVGADAAVVQNGSDVYIVDESDNHILEIPGTSKTQWGRTMTAGDMYVVAGSLTGELGDSGSGSVLSGFLLNAPGGLAFGSSGNMIIADTGNDRVLVVPAASGTYYGVPMTVGDVYRIAGQSGTAGTGGDGAADTSSYLDNPVGLAVASADLYIADAGNNRVQEIYEGGDEWAQTMTAGDIYTVAGSSSGTSGDTVSTAATSALLNLPEGVTLDSGGNLYIADTGNNAVKEVAKAAGTQWGTISMTAHDLYDVAGSSSGASGTSGDGSKGPASLLYLPITVAVASTGLYIADSANNRVQEVALTGHTEWGISMTIDDVYTVAGSSSGTCGDSGDGGSAISAKMCYDVGISVTASTAIYIADQANNRVREVSSSDVISTYAGTGWQVADSGNSGPAVNAALYNPEGEAFDSAGDVFIADAWNNRIQEIAAHTHTQFGISMTAGDVYTVAGNAQAANGSSGDGSVATSGYLYLPQSITADSAGNLYIADSDNCRIQKIAAATGVMSTVAGSSAGTCGTYAGNAGAATSATLSQMQGIALDSGGDIFIADTFNNRVEEVYEGGESLGQTMTKGDIYTVAGTGTQGYTGNAAAATSAELYEPDALGADGAGNLYISDWGNNRVREVPVATGTQRGQSMTKNDIYVIAGNGTAGTTGDGGAATSAELHGPGNATVDAAGNLYISDTASNRVQEVPVASGTQWGQKMTANDVYTVVGSSSGASGSSGDGGPGTSARLTVAENVSLDPEGDVYVTDKLDDRLREMVTHTPATITPAPSLTSALYPAPGGITVTEPGGADVTFYSQSSGTCPTAPYTRVAGQYCALPQDIGTSLTYNSSTSTYTFQPQPGTAYTYNFAGHLTAQEQVNGSGTAINTLTVGYGTPAVGAADPQGVTCPSSVTVGGTATTITTCDTITAPVGSGGTARTLVLGLANDSAGHALVRSVTDPLGRTWLYGYTGDNLTTVQDPLGKVTSYGYDTGNANPLLTSDILTITKPNGQTGGADAGKHVTLTWNTAGQVASVTDPMGFKTTYTWTAYNPSTGTGFITVADPDGNKTVYDYQLATLAAQSTWTGSTLTSEQDSVPDQSTASGDNSAGTQLDTATTDGNGDLTTASYDTSGNPVAVTAPDGVGTQQAITTQQSTSLDQTDCSQAVVATSTCTASPGPAPVAPGGTISPPSAAPPQGITWTQYDTLGNELWATTGVHEPGSSAAAYLQTTYHLSNGNSVTLNGTSISCATTAPSTTLPCATINADGVVTQLAYDANGDLTASSTLDGNSGSELATTAYGYDGDGERTFTTSPDGNLSGANPGDYTTITAWNSGGQQTSVSQGDGTGHSVTPRVTNYGHDGDGNQTTVQDARGFTTTTTYNADDQSTLVADPDGNKTLTCYDGAGNTTQTVPATGVAANSLTAASCPASYPAGYTTRLATDATSYAYDGLNHQTAMYTPVPVGQTSASGYETTAYAYDGDGNVIQTTAPATTTSGPAQVTVDTYTTTSQLASQTTGSGTSAAATVGYCYDAVGNRTAVISADGNVSGVDPCGTNPSYPNIVDPTTYASAAAYQTIYSYDSVGEQVSTTTPSTAAAPSGATTTMTYDAAGNKLTQTDPDGVITSYAYTPGNVEASVTYSEKSSATVGGTPGPLVSGVPLSASHSLCLDDYHSLTSAGNVIDISQCNGTGAQNWTVKPNGTLEVLGNCLDASGNGTTSGTLAVLEPCSSSTAGEIWQAGAHGSWVNPNSGMCLDDPSSTTTSGTQLQIWWCNGSGAQDWASDQYIYDANGSKTRMGDATGTSSYTYDPFGEVSSTTNGDGQAVSYSHTPTGSVASIGYPLPSTATWATTSTVNFSYDNAGLLSVVTDFNGSTTTIGDTADGKPSSIALGATGDTIADTYDSTGAPSAITLNNGTATLQSFTYADGPAADILSETDTPASPQSPAAYTYDAGGRVTSMTPGSGSVLNYGFDPSGNLTTLPTGATATYDHAGELTSSALSGTTTSYTYNAAGQRLTAMQGTTTVASGTWNDAAELTGYSNSTASMSAAVYSGSGLRASTTITPSGQSATTQQYVWNTQSAIPEMIMDSNNAYIYGDGVAPIEQVSLATGAITYLVTDSLGSVRGAVSSAGTLTGTASYDAWGNPETLGGLTTTTPFGYAGGYTDPDGLVYLMARYYDPSAGQFLSVDPFVSQTLQPYEYANGNPVTNADPTGRFGAVSRCGWSYGWSGAHLYCGFYVTRFTTRILGVDVSDWGVAAAAIVDAALCTKVPAGPYVAAACLVVAAVYEFWTIHEINVANAIGGCLTFTVGVYIGWGVNVYAYPGAVSRRDYYCRP
jgi:RHS repeat-associated protein